MRDLLSAFGTLVAHQPCARWRNSQSDIVGRLMPDQSSFGLSSPGKLHFEFPILNLRFIAQRGTNEPRKRYFAKNDGTSHQGVLGIVRKYSLRVAAIANKRSDDGGRRVGAGEGAF
jgi:hypothetical protein